PGGSAGSGLWMLMKTTDGATRAATPVKTRLSVTASGSSTAGSGSALPMRMGSVAAGAGGRGAPSSAADGRAGGGPPPACHTSATSTPSSAPAARRAKPKKKRRRDMGAGQARGAAEGDRGGGTSFSCSAYVPPSPAHVAGRQTYAPPERAVCFCARPGPSTPYLGAAPSPAMLAAPPSVEAPAVVPRAAPSGGVAARPDVLFALVGDVRGSSRALRQLRALRAAGLAVEVLMLGPPLGDGLGE